MDALTLLRDSPPLLYTFAVLFGLAVGSFLNVVIMRLPRMLAAAWEQDCAELAAQSASAAMTDSGPAGASAGASSMQDRPFGLAWPPSHCPGCQYRLRVGDNIPLLSYLLLRGRCRNCGMRISPRYPLIEALTALVTLIVVWHFGLTWQLIAALPLTWGLLALAVIDFDTQLLPDILVLPLLWLGLLVSVPGLFVDSQTAILGAATGYLSLWLVFQIFRLLTGKEGMGHGDFKLLAMLGAWMGWQVLPQIVLLSALPGALVGGMLIARGWARQAPIPFGPFLALSGWVVLLWGEPIAHAYFSWSGLG